MRVVASVLLFLFTLSQHMMGVSSLIPLLVPKKIKTAGTLTVAGGLAAAGALGTWLSRRGQVFSPKPGSLQDQTIVITGGSTGLGLESAKRLAAAGANVILTARTEAKGEASVEKVLEYLKEKDIENRDVAFQVLDLDDLASVREASNWKNIDKVDVLLNNAGCMALPERELTVDGVERQMQSNHLGHFALTALLAPKFSDSARIINVASTAHEFASKGLEFDYLWTGEPNYGAWKSYGQSKLANIIYTQELQRRIDAAGKGWSSVTLHPGVIATDLWRSSVNSEDSNFLAKTAGKVFMAAVKTPEQGANTQVFLAARAEQEDVRGKYLKDCEVSSLAVFARDAEAGKRLWEESEEKCGIKFEM